MEAHNLLLDVHRGSLGCICGDTSREGPFPIQRDHLSIATYALGLVFSFAWFCINAGSEHWQENWENHVDLLEDELTGPLYKSVLSRALNPSTMRLRERLLKDSWITRPYRLSVAKVNQTLSFYVTVLWFCMILGITWPWDFTAPLDRFDAVVVAFALAMCISSDRIKNIQGDVRLRLEKRKTEVVNPES